MKTKRIINKELMNEIFWSNVDKSLGENECWNWEGLKFPDGYGRFRIGQKNFRAHRYSWELKNEKSIPDGLLVLHSCIGNPLCVNPSHLRIGTQKDNMHDAVIQGRHVHPNISGENNGNSILSDIQREEIIKIRKENPKISLDNIGKMYGVSRGAITGVIKNKTKWFKCNGQQLTHNEVRK